MCLTGEPVGGKSPSGCQFPLLFTERLNYLSPFQLFMLPWQFWAATTITSALPALAVWTKVKKIFMCRLLQGFSDIVFYFFLSFFFFPFWTRLRGFWRQRKGTHFWHTVLKVKPAVSQQSQQVVIFVLQSFGDMNAHWSCKKGQGKKTYIQGHVNYQRNRNGKRKQQKCQSV